MLANGKLRPHLDVEPTLYRFRILNGSNGRFFRFSLANAHPFHQIASDQGLLSAPVPLKRVVLAPAERADILINFSSHRRTAHRVRQRQLLHPAVPSRTGWLCC